MKNIKKKAWFMTLLLGSLALAACGGSRSSASSKKSESESVAPASESTAPASESGSESQTASEESSSSSKKRRSSSATEDELANLPSFNVKIDPKDGSDPVVKSIKQTQPIEKPADPEAPAGKTFYGWKNVKNGGQIWNFDDEWLNAVYADVELEPLFIDSSLVESRVEAELAPIITEADDGAGLDGATYSGGNKGRGLIYKVYDGEFNIEPMYYNDPADDDDEDFETIARFATESDPADSVYGAFAHFLYKTGIKLTYKVTCTEAIDNAIFFMKIASEYGKDDIDPNDVQSTFTDQMVPVTVNGTPLQYGTVTVHGIVLKEMMPFQDYLLSTAVSLNAGENTIEIEVANNTLIFGTLDATAPMIDCLKIYAPSAITTSNAKMDNLNKEL